jgi:choline dehydrogenase-like flavoprotein
MQRKHYDVCVIGSGAAGGTLASQLALLGANVLLIEGGSYRDPAKLHSHAWPYEPHVEEVPRVTIDPIKEPYEMVGDPNVDVSRARVLGGRTTHWNAVSLRFAANDFREWSVNGIEEDWPISYAELAPYYDRAEQLMVVCGTKENLEVLPDGQFIRPLKLRCSEKILSRASEKLGLRLIPVRKALATEAGHGRLPCHYCGHCMSGCSVSAIFNSAEHAIPQGQATGRLDVRTGWMAHQLFHDQGSGDQRLHDTRARVRRLRIVEREGRRDEEVEADVFAVCGGNIESARLLLNSRSSRFPNGLANGNDMVGRYLHGHSTAMTLGYLSGLVGRRPSNQDGATDHAYIPRFIAPRDKQYRGGFGLQMNFMSYMKPYHASYLKGYGAEFKRRVRELHPAHSMMTGFGKVTATPDNRVTLHPARKDANGLPVPVVHFRWSGNDRALHADMRETAKRIYEAAGVELLEQPGAETPSGFASHEVGCVRMGKDPKTSVLNENNQTREVKNLFVVDGSSFTTFPEKNPTLTIVALALRTAGKILDLKRRGEV